MMGFGLGCFALGAASACAILPSASQESVASGPVVAFAPPQRTYDSPGFLKGDAPAKPPRAQGDAPAKAPRAQEAVKTSMGYVPDGFTEAEWKKEQDRVAAAKKAKPSMAKGSAETIDEFQKKT